MQKLLITALLFMLGLWVWNEFFRAIPHLQEKGVLKNFKVEPVKRISATYIVHDHRFVKPDRRVLHQASPVVGHFNDLAYLSNIDVLLLTQPLPAIQAKLEFDEAKRCYLTGDLVTVHSGTTGQEFRVGTGSEYRAHCQLLQVTHLQPH